ncbi:MAG: tetratricopeptide repeat protein [Candidatus Adiutrix sp.]|jgi:tetratricopeptide (TPR) repeat protein|nr:tetratricopeptide repeat protein [Candidatus Adiutrix sp.]
MDHLQDEQGPRRVIKKGPGPGWFLYPLIAAFLLAAAAGLWHLAAPQSFARVQGRLFGDPLEVRGLSLTVDRQTVTIPAGGSVDIHPGQNFTVSGLDTNRRLNYDLSLASPDFNINAVVGGATASPRQLLGDKAFEGPPRGLRIEVRDGAQAVALFHIQSHYSALDFAAQGAAAADAATRAESFRRALALDPDSESLRDKLLAALNESGQKHGAIELLEAELGRLGPDEDLLERLLPLYTEMNQPREAIRTLGRLIELAAGQGRPYLDLMRRMADIYQQNGWAEQAAEIFEEMLKQAPQEQVPEILGGLLALYREQGRPDREIDTLKRLLAVSPPEASAALWKEITALYEESEDEAGRVEAWKSLAAILPDGQDKLNAYKMLAHFHRQAGRNAEALEAYRAALKLGPKDGNILLNLARLSFTLGDRDGYRDYLARGMALSPDDLELRRELADAYREDGLNAKARAEYLELLKRAPEDQAARLLLVDVLEEMDDKKGLAAHYAELAKQNPDDAAIAYNYGAALYESKQFKAAIEVFKKLLAHDPTDSAVREYLLAAYQQTKQTEAMLNEALELYRLDPSKTVYRALMLNTYENAGNWNGFEAAALEAAELSPGDIEAWRALLKAQTQLKKTTEAAETQRKIEELSKQGQQN